MQVFVETQRLVLRRFTMADVDNLVSLDADPDVMHFITGGRPTPRDEIENEVLPAFLAYYERFDGYGFWAAIEKPAGEFLGWFHFRPREGACLGEAELGYRLRKSAWGKGYATEGSRALIRKGFTEFGVQRVVAEAMAVNLASRRVMEKAGRRWCGPSTSPGRTRLRATSWAMSSMRWTRPTGSSKTEPTRPALASTRPRGRDRPHIRQTRSNPTQSLAPRGTLMSGPPNNCHRGRNGNRG
jgi:RimJ/RimL family protein N-acetyltransferase